MDDPSCEAIDFDDLSALQYARFAAALLEEESRQWPAATRAMSVRRGKVEVGQKFRFRGVLLEGKPYVAPTVEQEVYAPDEWNLAKQPRHAMASLVGLKVQPLGPMQSWYRGLIVCNESMRAKPLDDEEQQRLVSMTKTSAVKEATKRAPLGELVLLVSRNCSNGKDLKLSFVASALRPCLTGQEEKVRKVRGFEEWRDLPPANYLLTPQERQDFIEAQVAKVSTSLFGAALKRLEGSEHFVQLEAPKLLLGQGRAVQGREKSSRMLQGLLRSGAYRLKHASAPRLGAVLFGKATVQETQAAEEVLRSMLRKLGEMGIDASADALQTLPPQNEALRDVLSSGPDAFLFFATGSLSSRDANQMYERSKYECLCSDRRHVASQWFDLKKRNLWNPEKSAFGFGVGVGAVGLLGKLGHVPWAVDARRWFRGPADVDVAVAGYDVCHLPDPRDPRRRHHVAAGIRVSSLEPMVLGKISFRTQRVKAETVPRESLREMLPATWARGKLLLLHRDGEFPHAEIESLKAYHAELAQEDPRTCFILMELVKWAGGSPRLYHGTSSAQAGSMFKFHKKEVLLSSSKELFQGTANPINVRLTAILGSLPRNFAMEDFAWVQSVFDLSYLHHGSVARRPRLPITTHFADRLAYVLASAEGDWDRDLAEVSERDVGVQFWL